MMKPIFGIAINSSFNEWNDETPKITEYSEEEALK